MGDVSDMRLAFSLLGNESDKPRVRAEPDEPKAPYASDCSTFLYENTLDKEFKKSHSKELKLIDSILWYYERNQVIVSGLK